MTQFDPAMRRALELALLGPAHGVNPQVGAVILDADLNIVAEGYHKGSGTAHAEVVALEALRQTKSFPLQPGFTAVVTLEPCNHTGRTGPCAQALIEAGISRVVFASKDPGDASSGGGQTLLDAGVDVIDGVLLEQAENQGRVWLSAYRNQRPFVTLKWASSLDGRTAAQDGSSKWISGAASRNDSHLRRSEVDAILVGTGTVVADDPELTARRPDGSLYEHQPLRVVLGKRELESDLRVFNDKAATLRLRTNSVAEALADLWQRGIKHVWVEGGPHVASEFVKQDLVDEFVIYLAPMLLGGNRTSITDLGIASMDQALELEILEHKMLEPDVFIRARRK